MIDALVQHLCENTGLNSDQVRAGLGLVLRLLKSNLGGNFSQVESVLPEAEQLIAAAPQPGAMGGFASALFGGLGGGKLAGLASLVGSAGQAGISESKLVELVQKAAPFLEQNGHGNLAGMLKELV
jgi:hypothetical protein